MSRREVRLNLTLGDEEDDEDPYADVDLTTPTETKEESTEDKDESTEETKEDSDEKTDDPYA